MTIPEPTRCCFYFILDVVKRLLKIVMCAAKFIADSSTHDVMLVAKRR
jgi:hypothetical protein